ncbi:MAG: hypothetical protein WBD07_12675, partial [Vicinamibacterales bacterium]
LAALAAAVVGAPLLAQAPPAPAAVRVDISGVYAPTISEDQPHRGPGPELGDYTGLPLNDAARQKAEAWDATILSQPERQAQAHPAQYWMRGPQPPLRILAILDPVTQTQFAYTIAGGFGRADRIVYIDGRNHPSDYSEHTWDGYSTGEWDANGQFVVTTTHMKYGVIQRNGAPTSPYGKMTEHFVRHGLYLMLFWSVDDPIYFEEPMVRTHNWTWNPGGQMGLGNPFESVDELGDKPLGWVPFFALGTKQTEFAEMHNLPFKATQGGGGSLYPEYMDRIKQFAAEEAAEKAAAAKKAEEAKAAATRRR